MNLEMGVKKYERLQVAPLGEYYEDLLTVDAWIEDRPKSAQANTLLCNTLQEREPKLRERVAYLAKKRGIDPQEFWIAILKGNAEKISHEEIAPEKE